MNVADKLEKLQMLEKREAAPNVRGPVQSRRAGEIEYESWFARSAGELEYRSWFAARG